MQLQVLMPPSRLDRSICRLQPAEAPTASTNGEKKLKTIQWIQETFSLNKTLIKRYEATLLMNNISD